MNLMNGYTGLPTTEGPGEEEPKPKLSFNIDGAADKQADARDILSFFAGSGYTGLTDKQSRAAFSSLTKTVGPQLAQKLATQVFLYNQRPETKTAGLEDRVRNFYDIGSNDKEVDAYLKKTKALGHGVVAGFKDSTLVSNQALQGRDVKGGSTPQSEALARINTLISNTAQ